MNLFQILNSNSSVKSLLGTSPLRVFPWGEAPQGVLKPYATYGVFNGAPQNTMGEDPQIDVEGTQIDVWGETASSVKQAAEAIRDSLESFAHMISYEKASRDVETKLYHSRMDFDFFAER